jgi:hypothetical protein
MAGRKSTGDLGTKMDETIDFLREISFVKEISGKPSLTSNGKRFLQALEESPSRSPSGYNPSDCLSFSEGATSR